MKPKHLNCTTENRRIQICQDYEVHADDCIVLYGGHTIRSDANNREIHDKYYQFSCKEKNSEEIYVITCGSNAARHLCSLINEPMPHAMNPFIQENLGNNEQNIQNEHSEHGKQWNHLRRQFYYAIQLFITRYQSYLTPGTKIFNLLKYILDERYIGLEPNEYHYESLSSVVSKFNTNLPKIIRELENYGQIRTFDFTDLANKMTESFPQFINIFLDDQ